MNRNGIWRVVSVLLLGQLASLFLAVASFTSSYITDLGIDTPLFQSLLSYLSVSVVYGSILAYRRQKLQVPWYWYALLAFIDVQGNYLVTKAYQYSSITSVILLSCWIIPWVIILTWFILRTRYSLWQLSGAAICVVGLVLVLLSDSGVSGGGVRNPVLGDILVIAGTFCFALSAVGEEFCVKKKDLVEAIAMLGVFGVLVTACEISIFERKDLASVAWSPTMNLQIALFAGFAVASFLYATMTAFLLKMSGATLYNLSLLTTSMWTVLIRIFFYKQQVVWLFYISFAVAAVGLIIYSMNDAASTTNGVEESAVQYEQLPEGSSTDQPQVLDGDEESTVQYQQLSKGSSTHRPQV